MHDPEDRLDRLSANERHALRLLGEGHTAKSIAAETGKTESAIHERLREARRKTGVGSSRELARLLRARENRDGQFGMAPPPATTALPLASAAPWWRRRPEVIVMMLMLLAGAAFLVGPTQGPQTTGAPTTDPSVESALRTGPTPRERYMAIVGEERDAAWADPTEAALRRYFAALPFVAPGTQIRCGSRTCAAVGAIDRSVPSAEIETITRRFDLRPVEAETGLRSDEWVFTVGKPPAPLRRFVAFLKRTG